MRLIVLILSFLALALAQQVEEGNFELRFEPTAKLQTGAPIPFQISVKDALRKPVDDAKVTLRIETVDHQRVAVYPAPALDHGIYLAKPIFSSPGQWNVSVEVQRGNRVTGRTIEFNVPE